MSIYVVGAVLRIVFHDENGGVLPVRAVRNRVNHTPYVQTYGAANLPGSSVIQSTESRAIELIGGWRERVLLHQFNQTDPDFRDCLRCLV